MNRAARTVCAGAASALVVLACSGSSPSSSSAGDSGAPPGDAAVTDATGGGARLDAALLDGTTTDAVASATDAEAAAGCGEFAGDTTFTCAKDGNSRGKCLAGGGLDQEPCPNGCLIEPQGQDAICMGTTASNWSCTGSYGTTAVDDGNYYMSDFGCFIDDAGTHTDPGDNCIPGCLAKAQAAGLCDASDTGPECEERVTWYTADAARFGCLQRLRVTNPTNGKTLIAVALDFGPGCPGENTVTHAVLDSSGAIDDYLFGGPKGSSEKAVVHVVEVDDATPLGPVP